ncbi:MAG TPA: methyltransferase domain-containing protein [Streptosporangiaceae bacterium]|nr:methyltransferase domain-containing protein [Streptosporangiaceae bacterium]
MANHEVRSWLTDRPVTSPFARPRGLRGRLAGRFMVWTNKQGEVAGLLGVRPGDRVLEVGYGGGALVRLLARRVGDGLVCGVDPSPDMRDLAVRRNRRAVAAGRLDLRVGTAAATGFPDAAFDHVVTVNTVGLWPDLEAGLRELRRVIRPGGDVVIAWHGGRAPTRIGRRLLLPESALVRVRDALAAFFAEVERHELTTVTAFRARRATMGA